jgi:hypothetical protein
MTVAEKREVNERTNETKGWVAGCRGRGRESVILNYVGSEPTPWREVIAAQLIKK